MASPEADRLVHTEEEQAELDKELARLRGIQAMLDKITGPPMTLEQRLRMVLHRQIGAPD